MGRRAVRGPTRFVTKAQVEEYVQAALAKATGQRSTGATVVAGSEQAAPLNTNTNFELDLADWTMLTAGSLTRSNAQAHQGSWSARLVPDGTSATPRMETGSYLIDPTHRYQIAAWVRPDTANKIPRLYAAWFTEDTTFISQSTVDVTPVAGTWQLLRAIVVPAEGAAKVRLGVGIQSTPAVGDAVHVDEATLHDIDSPRPPLQVVMDGSALAVPVKQVRGVPVGVGARVMLEKVGADPRTAEWVCVGPVSDPSQGQGNRLAVGGDVPSELRFYGVEVATLWYIVDATTGVELGYFFEGLSNSIQVSGVIQKYKLSGQVIYPVAGDPTSATDLHVKTWQRISLSGITIFRDNPIIFSASVDSVTIAAGTDFIVEAASEVTLNRPSCKLFRSAALSVAKGGSPSVIGWDGEAWDTQSVHSLVTNTSRIGILNDGKAQISGHIKYASNATGSRGVMVRKNSAGNSASGTLLHEILLQAVVTAGHTTSVPFIIEDSVLAGDYIEVFAYQNSGAARDLVVGVENSFVQVREMPN